MVYGVVFNQFKTVLLLGLLTGLLLVVGQFFGGSSGLTFALFFVFIMNFGAYFFSDKIVLKMYGAKEASKSQYSDLNNIVGEVSKSAGVPKPKVFIIPSKALNAFATGRNPNHAVVACTEGILSHLSAHELKGVVAHEIAHVKNRDILVTTVAATIAGVISYLAQMAQFFAIFGGGSRDDNKGNIFGFLILAIVTPIIAMIIQMAISRSREFLADESGARFINDGKSLASALKKLDIASKSVHLQGNPATSSLFIVNPFSARGFTSFFSTHPSTDERIKRLNNLKF